MPFRRLLLALVLCCSVACAPPERPAALAQSFWDAVAAGRVDDALDRVLPGDGDTQRKRIAALEILGAEVEMLEVPPEAEVALLPTRIVRGDEAETWTLDAVTVLRRVDDVWRVDLDATRTHLRSASVDAVGRRLQDAADQLRDAVGRSASDLAEGVERFGSQLRERLEAEGGERADELADEVSRGIEAAGAALVEGLKELERALAERREPDDDGRAPPPDSGDPRP